MGRLFTNCTTWEASYKCWLSLSPGSSLELRREISAREMSLGGISVWKIAEEMSFPNILGFSVLVSSNLPSSCLLPSPLQIQSLLSPVFLSFLWKATYLCSSIWLHVWYFSHNLTISSDISKIWRMKILSTHWALKNPLLPGCGG